MPLFEVALSKLMNEASVLLCGSPGRHASRP
ncbi:MAG: hypothetical protein ACI9OF_000962, partial [Saprospiraceae bacterium]